MATARNDERRRPKGSRPRAWLAVALGVLGCSWLGGASNARANPVNAEKLLTDPKGDGWSGSFDTRLSLSKGNVDRLDFNTGGGLQYWTLYPEGSGYREGAAPEGVPRFFRDRWVLMTSGTFIRVKGSDVVNRGFGHMRYTRMWIPRLGSDFFTQVQFNEFTRLRVRFIGGLGLRVDPIRRKRVQAWLGTGYMAEYELNDTIEDDPATPSIDETDPHPAKVFNHRWTSYGVVQLTLFEGQLLMRNTVYSQPRFDDFTDIRVLEAAQVEAKVGDTLALGIDFQAQYDSRPPREVVPLDLLLGSYIRLGFG